MTSIAPGYVEKSSVTAGQVPEVALSDEEKVIKIVGPMTEVDRTRFLEFFPISGISADNEAAVLDFYRNYRHHLTPGESISEAQRIFLNATGMDDETLLARAIQLEKFHLIPDLLACGAAVMKPVPFGWIHETHAGRHGLALAIAFGAPCETLELLIKAAEKECAPAGENCMSIESGGATPLFLAAQFDHATCIPLLIAAGAAIEEEDESTGETPLIRAAKMGNAAVCEALLTAGANVNAQNKRDLSSLYYAVDGRNLQIAKLLLNHNAAWDSDSLGELVWDVQMAKAFAELTPLPFNRLLAIAGSQPGVNMKLVTFLVTKGADVDFHNDRGLTALQMAVRTNSANLIIPLLKLGADINRTTADGLDTALSIALQLHNRNMATILLDHGAVLRPEHFAEFDNTFPPAPGSAPL